MLVCHRIPSTLIGFTIISLVNVACVEGAQRGRERADIIPFTLGDRVSSLTLAKNYPLFLPFRPLPRRLRLTLVTGIKKLRLLPNETTRYNAMRAKAGADNKERATPIY